MNDPSLSAVSSGPRVARLFAWVLAVLWLIAWWSWGIQLQPLVGTDGVWPLTQTACPPGAEAAGAAICPPLPALAHKLAPYLVAPAGDVLLLAAVALGLLFATAAICSFWPRAMLLGCAVTYAGFVAASQAFFPSIGDKLLLEATALAVLLPRDRPARRLHLLARLVVVKLYVGVGLSQWLATGNGWQRGSALREFLQNTPLPTLSGWYAAHLPGPLVSGATKLVVFIQLWVPWLCFGPRAARLFAAALLTALQVVLVSLVNDGLFSYVAVTLHLLLLSDGDVAAMEGDLTGLGRGLSRLFAGATRPAAAPAAKPQRWLDRLVGVTLVSYLTFSLAGLFGTLRASAQPGASAGEPGRTARMGYTFARVGRPHPRRVEPIFEVQSAGKWSTVELWHQPGDPWRPPVLVAPHQPRLDARLSLAGQAYDQPNEQGIVWAMLRRLCRPGGDLQRLLRSQLPAKVQAVRVHYDSYTFADWTQHQETGVWWTRAQVADGPSLVCPD